MFAAATFSPKIETIQLLLDNGAAASINDKNKVSHVHFYSRFPLCCEKYVSVTLFVVQEGQTVEMLAREYGVGWGKRTVSYDIVQLLRDNSAREP